LGELSPIGQLFSLGSFLKITNGARIFGQLFFHRKNNASDLTKNGLGYILGSFSQSHLATLLVGEEEEGYIEI
jgi:hypothetical protein